MSDAVIIKNGKEILVYLNSGAPGAVASVSAAAARADRLLADADATSAHSDRLAADADAAATAADRTAAADSAAAAAASATTATDEANLIVGVINTKTSRTNRLIEFIGPLKAVFAYVATDLTWYVVNLVSKLGYGIGTRGSALKDSPSGRDILQATDQAGNVYASLGLDGVKAKAATLTTVNGMDATRIATLLGQPSLTLGAATRYFVPTFGQSLAAGVGATTNPVDNSGAVALTTTQYYSDLMFHGGVRPDDVHGLGSADITPSNDDLTSLVAHVESALGGVSGAGETILGGFQAMLFQLLNAYGLSLVKAPFHTICAAIQKGGSPIADFRSGGPPFTRLMNAATAAKALSGGGHNVQMPGFFWMQGESGQNDDGYITQLTSLATEVDAAARAILTQQSDPAVTFTYQLDRAQGAHWYTEAQRLSPLVRIVGPMYPIQIAGLRGVQNDNVHRSAPGYRHYGAQCAIAWFCHVILKRPWRPLQLSYDARGRLRCRVDGNDLIVFYDVPHGGWLKTDIGNWGQTWARRQRGFYLFNSGGTEKPLKDAVVEGRDGVRLIGASAAAGDILRVGYTDPTNSNPATLAVNLRDCQGDVITFDDGADIRIDNWAIGEEHTLTSAELS